jgi:hypothetical protein
VAWVVVQDVAQLAQEVGPFIGAALGSYGARVLDKVEDQAVDVAGDAAAGFGRRLLQLVTGRPGPATAEVVRAVERAGANPGNDDRVAAVRVAVEDALAADELLAGEVRALLGSEEGRGAVVAWGERSVAARSIVGSTVNTGDIHLRP